MNGQDWLLIGALSLMLLVPTSLFGIWQARAVVIANDAGLRWRGMGGWRIARWSDVTDYYDQLGAKSKPLPVVKTDVGVLSLNSTLWNSGLWTVTPELRQLIRQKATQAQAKEWGILGMRPEADWPRVFDYNTLDNRFAGIFVPGMAVVMIGLLLWQLRYTIPGILETAAMGWGWGLATLVLCSFGYLPMVVILLLPFQQQRALRRRRNQRITLTQDGVIYEDRQHKVEAPWADISDLHFARNKGLIHDCVVISKQGMFNFSLRIKDFAILRRALTTFATALPEAKWRAMETDMLGGEASRWTSRRVGVGKRIYHYRTRFNCIQLLGITVIALTFFGLEWLLPPLGLSPRVPGQVIFLSGMIGILTAWGWWHYWAAGITIDDEGITQRTLWGAQHLTWEEVIDYYKTDGDTFRGVVMGTKTRLRFWCNIGEVEELQSEIVRRAKNSRNQTWDKDGFDQE